jgi:hypothetical protein
VSNVVTIPIHVGKGTCSDPQLGYDGTQISTLNGPTGQGSVRTGFLIVSQATAPESGTVNFAAAIFQKNTGFFGHEGNLSIGGCLLGQTIVSGPAGTDTGLNPGTITVTGPDGAPVTLSSSATPGLYIAAVPSIPSTGGAYVFNASAGSQVGGFTSTVSFPSPALVWTSVASVVSRNQGLNVTWTGGAPGSYVTISGVSGNGSVIGLFTCHAPQSALTFTVPSYVLLGLPAGTGSTAVTNSTKLATFAAAGLDFGGAIGSVSFSVNSNYN